MNEFNFPFNVILHERVMYISAEINKPKTYLQKGLVDINFASDLNIVDNNHLEHTFIFIIYII